VTDQLHLSMDADPHLVSVLRHAVQSWLAVMRWPRPAADELVFAISEAVSNSVEHAYRDISTGSVTVDITAVVDAQAGARAIDVVVTDFGRWRPHRPDPTRGNGLPLMKAVMATSRVETDGTGTRVTMRSLPLS
jgi:serine/threonine-protein kinase RsbW